MPPPGIPPLGTLLPDGSPEEPLEPLGPLLPPLGGGGIPPPGDGIPPLGGIGTDTPPEDEEDSLHAPVTTAANAIRISGLIQLAVTVDGCLLGIVLTLCIAQTVQCLEHFKGA
jgi:hypothetical protein